MVSKLLELAKRIKEKGLREKVIEIIKHPALSNTNLKYSPADLKECPASINFHHIQQGGLVEHTCAVTKISISIAETLQSVYKTKLDMDALIAGALVHDIGKLWSMKKVRTWNATPLTLDHTMLGTSELYARGFPEKVLHIVASHFGDQGPTPPQTVEAIIFHYVDSLDAVLGTQKQEDILKLILG